MDDFEKTLLRSRMDLPYPANYIAIENPGLAYVLMKMLDKIRCEL